MFFTTQSGNPKRTPEEWHAITYVAEILDEKFEELVSKRGRTSEAKYYSEDHPLIVLQKNTEDLVASTVVKIVNNDELADGILSQFDFTDPDIHKKADDLLHNALKSFQNK